MIRGYNYKVIKTDIMKRYDERGYNYYKVNKDGYNEIFIYMIERIQL